MENYAYAFTHLKRAPTRYGAAPHKPVLLLSLLELIGKGAVTDNRFAVNAELVGTFILPSLIPAARSMHTSKACSG